MRIGLLSICAMMFLLYGTDCFARESVKDTVDNWGEFSKVDESKRNEALRNKAFEQRMKDAKIEEGSVKALISKFDQQDNQKKSDKISENFEDGKNVREALGSEQYKETADSATPARQGPWFRDKRSFADVVKGVKKEDENAKSEGQFHDAIDFENNVWLEEKNRNEKNSDKFNQLKEPVVSDDQIKSEEKQVVEENKIASPRVRRSKKAYGTEMTKNQRAARSKKAFDARRSRERQRKKFTDEVRKN
ncbi:MAG: hypothetical protein J6T91_04845 [Alphaproteobacteria bacterium]|nr:hypothetical protein [Alphaproteobacteria bacterium]